MTVLGYQALDIGSDVSLTYYPERTIYLTSSDEIAVHKNCFSIFEKKGLLKTTVNLVLSSNKQSEVSGNTWTTKDADGNEVSFTFKSITFVD